MTLLLTIVFDLILIGFILYSGLYEPYNLRFGSTIVIILSSLSLVNSFVCLCNDESKERIFNAMNANWFYNTKPWITYDVISDIILLLILLCFNLRMAAGLYFIAKIFSWELKKEYKDWRKRKLYEYQADSRTDY